MIMLVGSATAFAAIFPNTFKKVSISLSSPGHQMILTKMKTFLKVFENIYAKVVLLPTNMIICQSNIKNYEYDNDVPIFAYGKI